MAARRQTRPCVSDDVDDPHGPDDRPDGEEGVHDAEDDKVDPAGRPALVVDEEILAIVTEHPADVVQTAEHEDAQVTEQQPQLHRSRARRIMVPFHQNVDGRISEGEEEHEIIASARNPRHVGRSPRRREAVRRQQIRKGIGERARQRTTKRHPRLDSPGDKMCRQSPLATDSGSDHATCDTQRERSQVRSNPVGKTFRKSVVSGDGRICTHVCLLAAVCTENASARRRATQVPPCTCECKGLR